MSSIFNIQEHTLPGTYIREYARATANSQEDTLLLHVKQYTPKDNLNPQPGDVSLVGAHANGFPKEMYEPLWEELFHGLQKQGIRIRSIWTIDAAWQGQSGIINRGKLGNDPSWLDYGRDIYQVINTVRMPRPIIGVGHSFGAAAITNTALANPRLFNSLILLDPVIEMARGGSMKYFIGPESPAAMSAFRRDSWPSRQAAAEAFQKSKFYKSWDHRALQRWIEFGITDGPDGTAILATTRDQEVRTFLRPSMSAFNEDGSLLLHPDKIPEVDRHNADIEYLFPVYRPESSATWLQLRHVRPSVLYIFGGDSYLSPEISREAKLNLTGISAGGSGGAANSKVKQIVGEGYGHLIPIEDPAFCAAQATDWIKEQLNTWWDDEKEYKNYTNLPAEKKAVIEDDMMALFKQLKKPKL